MTKTKSKHELIVDGVYAYVRHPMYTAMTAFVLGQAVYSYNIIMVLCAVPQFLMYFNRVGMEERNMSDAFPDTYPKFCEVRPRIWPSLEMIRFVTRSWMATLPNGINAAAIPVKHD